MACFVALQNICRFSPLLAHRRRRAGFGLPLWQGRDDDHPDLQGIQFASTLAPKVGTLDLEATASAAVAGNLELSGMQDQRGIDLANTTTGDRIMVDFVDDLHRWKSIAEILSPRHACQ